jgi:hypothetical protein
MKASIIWICAVSRVLFSPLALWSVVDLLHSTLGVIRAGRLGNRESDSPSTIGNALAIAVVGVFLVALSIVRQFTIFAGRFQGRRGCEHGNDRKSADSDFFGL